MRLATLRTAAVGAALFVAPAALAQTAQTLPFSQNWTDTGLITVDDVWTGVPGIVGEHTNEPGARLQLRGQTRYT